MTPHSFSLGLTWHPYTHKRLHTGVAQQRFEISVSAGKEKKYTLKYTIKGRVCHSASPFRCRESEKRKIHEMNLWSGQ
jgi:hypothetical protein